MPNDQYERYDRVSNELERLVNTPGAIKWEEPDIEFLKQSTKDYLKTCGLLDYGIKFWVADVKLEGTVLFKIEDDFACYLHHDPVTDVHMFADEGFHNAVNNNRALARLANKAVGVNADHLTKIFDEMDKIEPPKDFGKYDAKFNPELN